MSWLFGLRKDTNFPVPAIPTPGASDEGGNEDNKGQQQSAGPSRSEAYRFDSSALERAAQAAKELEKSSKCNTLLN
jgi:ATPase family AAA domain-containing protein 3A/B